MCNWVKQLGKRLEVITTCMKERVEVAAVQLKEGYNRHAKLRHFDVWRYRSTDVGYRVSLKMHCIGWPI